MVALHGAAQGLVRASLKWSPSPNEYVRRSPEGMRPAWERPGARPALRSVLRRPEVIHLAHIHAVVPQQRIRGRDVEEEVRQREVLQVGLAGHLDRTAAAR